MHRPHQTKRVWRCDGGFGAASPPCFFLLLGASASPMTPAPLPRAVDLAPSFSPGRDLPPPPPAPDGDAATQQPTPKLRWKAALGKMRAEMSPAALGKKTVTMQTGEERRRGEEGKEESGSLLGPSTRALLRATCSRLHGWQSLPEALKDAVVSAFKVTNCGRDQLVFCGEGLSRMYVIISGEFEAFSEPNLGAGVVAARYTRGDVMCEAALYAERPRSLLELRCTSGNRGTRLCELAGATYRSIIARVDLLHEQTSKAAFLSLTDGIGDQDRGSSSETVRAGGGLFGQVVEELGEAFQTHRYEAEATLLREVKAAHPSSSATSSVPAGPSGSPWGLGAVGIVADSLLSFRRGGGGGSTGGGGGGTTSDAGQPTATATAAGDAHSGYIYLVKAGRLNVTLRSLPSSDVGGAEGVAAAETPSPLGGEAAAVASAPLRTPDLTLSFGPGEPLSSRQLARWLRNPRTRVTFGGGRPLTLLVHNEATAYKLPLPFLRRLEGGHALVLRKLLGAIGPLKAEFSESEIDSLASAGMLVAYPPNAEVLARGSVSRPVLHFVIEGEARVVASSSQGRLIKRQTSASESFTRRTVLGLMRKQELSGVLSEASLAELGGGVVVRKAREGGGSSFSVFAADDESTLPRFRAPRSATPAQAPRSATPPQARFSVESMARGRSRSPSPGMARAGGTGRRRGRGGGKADDADVDGAGAYALSDEDVSPSFAERLNEISFVRNARRQSSASDLQLDVMSGSAPVTPLSVIGTLAQSSASGQSASGLPSSPERFCEPFGARTHPMRCTASPLH